MWSYGCVALDEYIYIYIYICIYINLYLYVLYIHTHTHTYIQESLVAARKQTDEDAAALAISAAEDRVRRLQEEGAKRIATLLDDLGRETEIREHTEKAVLTLEEQVANAQAEVLYACMYVCIYVYIHESVKLRSESILRRRFDAGRASGRAGGRCAS